MTVLEESHEDLEDSYSLQEAKTSTQQANEIDELKTANSLKEASR